MFVVFGCGGTLLHHLRAEDVKVGSIRSSFGVKKHNSVFNVRSCISHLQFLQKRDSDCGCAQRHFKGVRGFEFGRNQFWVCLILCHLLESLHVFVAETEPI